MRQNQAFSVDSPVYIAIIMLLSLALSMKAGVTDVYGVTPGHRRAGYRIELPPGEFGRKNPFMPLVLAKPIESAQQETSPEPEPVQTGIDVDSSDEELVIRLVAVLILNGAQIEKPIAIVEEKGISKSVYVGDAVAGMEVMEIHRGKISLKKGGEICRLTVGAVTKRQYKNVDDKSKNNS